MGKFGASHSATFGGLTASMRLGLGLVLLTAGASSLAASGAPLPRCSANSAAPSQFYLMRYMEATTANTAPQTILDLATVPASGAVTLTNIWNGQTAPTPSPRDLSPNAGATVAGGMGRDGYIYAMRAVGANEAGWDLQGNTWIAPGNEWRTHTRHYEMLRYGRAGVDNLGIVQGLGPYRMVANDPGTEVSGAIDTRLGPNFNAADIDPVTGIMYLANFQTGGSLNKVFRIDVTQTPPVYLDTLNLISVNPGNSIPGSPSGAFAIDAAGQWAYGVATTGSTNVSYRFRLSDGQVQTLATSGLGAYPYGAAARFINTADPNITTAMAFYGRTGALSIGTRVMGVPGGTLGPNQNTTFSNSADGAACLPKWVATLQCTPTNLVDAAGNVSNCTVTLDQPAPAGGLDVALVPPASNPRYTTTCGASVTVAAGATTAQCTITATPNTVPGDGFVDATLALATPAATADYELGTPNAATVRVDNDDLPSVRLSCVPPELTDSPGQVATCTIESNVPAPAGGMTVALTPPTGNPRYTTTCGTSVVLAAGASSATCTITATPNIVPGDGDVPATLTLTPPVAGAGYQLGAPDQATVLVRNDDAPLPVANLVCVPPTLTDSPGQVSTCTVTLNSPAPAGGLSLNLTPPAAGNPRYSSTCASPLVVAAGASSASCTITATPNTVTGDGSVVATVQLLPGTGYTVGTAQAQAQVTVNDDDLAPVPGLGWWGLLLVSLGLVAVAWRRQDRLA